MIKDVRIKDIDDSVKYLSRERTIEIKTNTGRPIITPLRAATSYEYEEKSKIPSEVTINNPITISIERLSSAKFSSFINSNNYYSKLLRKIELYKRMSQYSDLNIVLLRPSLSAKQDAVTKEIISDPPMKLLTDSQSIRDKFLRFVIRLQLDAGLNTITIPFMNLPIQVFQDTTTQICKSLEKIDVQPLFFIDIGYANFETAIKWLSSDLQAKAIGLYYKSSRTYPQSYDILSKYIDKDIAFITSQIPRIDYNHENISTMHYLPFFGYDVYAIEPPISFPPNESIGTPKKPVDKLQSVCIFNQTNLTVNSIRSAPIDVDNLKSNFRHDAIISDILENYQEASTNDEKLTILKAFTKVNELVDSTSEFINLQKYVGENSSKDYLDEKIILKRTLQNVKGTRVISS